MNVVDIWIVCGGVSTEHDISILSAKNVCKGLQDAGYTTHVVVVTQAGEWLYLSPEVDFKAVTNIEQTLAESAEPLMLVPGSGSIGTLVRSPGERLPCDCVFPLVHGTQGEDGVLQGVLQLCGVPYVGCGVMSSAICMSKHVAKVLLEAQGISTAPGVVVRSSALHAPDFSDLQERFGLPLFVKPSSQGSSVGISRVSTEEDYLEALENAFLYDDVVLVEKAIHGRELECSVLGDLTPRVSLPGEVISGADFYSFENKYVNDHSVVVTPADLTDEQVESIQEAAISVYRALYCTGMARVDFFLQEDGNIIVNEINTIPGFTDISMYPKNWAVSGLDSSTLLHSLIESALYCFQQREDKVTFFKLPSPSEQEVM